MREVREAQDAIDQRHSEGAEGELRAVGGRRDEHEVQEGHEAIEEVHQRGPSVLGWQGTAWRISATQEALANLRVRQKLLPGPGESVRALDKDVALVSDLQRLAGVLLDHEDGNALARDLDDTVEELVHDDR